MAATATTKSENEQLKIECKERMQQHVIGIFSSFADGSFGASYKSFDAHVSFVDIITLLAAVAHSLSSSFISPFCAHRHICRKRANLAAISNAFRSNVLCVLKFIVFFP